MKVNRTWCIDESFIPLLRETNASELVNRLLSEHFSAENSDNLPKIRLKTRELMQERAVFSKKIKHLKTKAIKIQTKLDKDKQKDKTQAQQAKRRLAVEEHKRKYENEEITEDEYWEFFE